MKIFRRTTVVPVLIVKPIAETLSPSTKKSDDWILRVDYFMKKPLDIQASVAVDFPPKWNLGKLTRMRISQFLIAGLALVIVSGCAVDRCGSRCRNNRCGMLQRIFAARSAKVPCARKNATCGCKCGSKVTRCVAGHPSSVPHTDYTIIQPKPTLETSLYSRAPVLDVLPPQPELEPAKESSSKYEERYQNLANRSPKVEPIQSDLVSKEELFAMTAPVEPIVPEPMFSEPQFEVDLDAQVDNDFVPNTGELTLEPEGNKIKSLSVYSSRVVTPFEPPESEVIENRPEAIEVLTAEEALEESKIELPASAHAYAGPIVLKAKAYEGSMLRKKPLNGQHRFAQRGEEYYQIGADQLRQVQAGPTPVHFEPLPPVSFGTTEKRPAIARLPILDVPMSGESRNETELRGDEVQLMPISRNSGFRSLPQYPQFSTSQGATEIVRLHARPTGQKEPGVESVARFTMRETSIVRGEKSALQAAVPAMEQVPELAEQLDSVQRLIKSGSKSDTIER